MVKKTKKAERIAMYMMHFKWIADGCKNWDEIIEVLKSQIEEAEYLKKLGCKIDEEVDGGHLSYIIPNDKIKDFCKSYKIENVEDLYPFDEDEEE